MNDLSILFPLATTESDFDTYLTMDTPGANGSLVPETLYNSDNEAAEIPYDNLRVVAIRLDPCFAHLGPITDPSTCDNQIRLVFQPLVFEEGMTIAEDAAVHVLYSLTRDQLLAAANEIAAARAVTTTTDLGPVAVHPIMASQGVSGAFAQALRAIIVKYADGTKIERITSFIADASGGGGPINGSGIESGGGGSGGSGTSGGSGSGSSGSGSGEGSGSGSGEGSGSGSGEGSGSGSGIDADFFWELHGESVTNGVETALVIPTLPDSTTDMSLDASASPLESNFSPVTSSTDNIVVLSNADQAMSAGQTQRQAAFDAALRIENPTMNSPNTIDCVSCHMAEPARALVGQQMFGMMSAGDSNAFVPASTIPAADLAATQTMLINADSGLNIHAFSYRETNPMINQRVINETAANLAYLQSL